MSICVAVIDRSKSVSQSVRVSLMTSLWPFVIRPAIQAAAKSKKQSSGKNLCQAQMSRVTQLHRLGISVQLITPSYFSLKAVSKKSYYASLRDLETFNCSPGIYYDHHHHYTALDLSPTSQINCSSSSSSSSSESSVHYHLRINIHSQGL